MVVIQFPFNRYTIGKTRSESMLAMVIGGSGSGKSEYAENLAVRLEAGRKLYIATMYPWDEESKKRIHRHQAMRAKKKFDTLECFFDLNSGIKKYWNETTEHKANTAFLDCMSNLVANEMYCDGGYGSKKTDTVSLVESVLSGIDLLCQRFEHVVLVSNDVFTDGVVYDEEMQSYLKHLGEINQGIVERADLVVEVVCGIPICHKGEVKFKKLQLSNTGGFQYYNGGNEE